MLCVCEPEKSDNRLAIYIIYYVSFGVGIFGGQWARHTPMLQLVDHFLDDIIALVVLVVEMEDGLVSVLTDCCMLCWENVCCFSRVC